MKKVICILSVLAVAISCGVFIIGAKTNEPSVKVEDIEIVFHMEESEEVREKVYTELRKLPIGVVEDFIEDNARIIIEDMPACIYGNYTAIVACCGVDSEDRLSITICDDDIEYALLHEFGHYIDLYNENVHPEKKLNYFLFSADKGYINYDEDLMAGNKYFKSRDEYFAECFKLYINDELDYNKYPNTVWFFNSLMKDFQ